jgi:SH3-like domain-containing protein
LPAGPTARIILDPGANLQLREYPSSQARSLGLAPSGTVLLVNGRAGAPTLPEGATPDPNATAFIDLATLVPEDSDLVPEETWLNVTYSTPDGGAIDAWVNSLYLDLRNPRGERMRLADLPTVPENQPGETRSTDITPPPIPEDRVVARVFNLDPGVNLNIRRTAATGGEVLERVQNGTLMEFLGLKESGDWVFVRYSPAGGGSVTGWVNAIYVELLFNDNLITLDELEARELLVITPDDERGEISGDIGALVQPTVNPLRDAVVAEVTIDPGANLHLRRTPDSNAESLALIPSSTLLLVTGRTGESNWLQVEFEDVQGWVSSAYVRLTFNGAPFELMNVPALTTPVPTTPTTQPAAPTTDPAAPTATPTV